MHRAENELYYNNPYTSNNYSPYYHNNLNNSKILLVDYKNSTFAMKWINRNKLLLNVHLNA